SKLNRPERVKSFDEAFAALESAAKTGQTTIKKMIEDDYDELTRTYSEIKPQVKSALKDLGDQSIDILKEQREKVMSKSRETADRWEARVRERPLKTLGWTALVALIFGFILGRRRR